MKSKSAPPEKVLLSSMQSSSPDGNPEGSTDRGSASSARPARSAKRAIERETGWRPKENILQIAAATGRFETLGRAVEAAGLTNTLSGNGPFTLFAPTDRAFSKLPPAELSALLADRTRLHKLLTNHVVPSAVRAPRRSAPSQVTTLDGNSLDIHVVPENGGYRVGDARIVKTNMRASNGVVHAIDTVLTAG